MGLKKHWPWIAWLLLTCVMAGALTYKLKSSNRRMFLPGPTTAGHYQIELDCNACHQPGLGAVEQACYDCHAAELKAANDSHPKSKFSDPRNADRLKLIQADNCIACHREHVPRQTHAMGVTMPADYCFHCHQQTLTDRLSHKNFAFDSCATAGCHNYHDNTALYEGFLLKHVNQPDTNGRALRPLRTTLAALIETGWKQRPPLAEAQADAPATVTASTNAQHGWALSAHARAGVNCRDCHEVTVVADQPKVWSDKLDHTACAACHSDTVAGFLGGKHGMRLARGLSPMTPGEARLPMKPASAHRELTCASCHAPHDYDTRTAAVDACLSCHNDAHSLAYKHSAHYRLWLAEGTGDALPGAGVSCATCHLPREAHTVGGTSVVRVQHNQNLNLRPNEKMIRTVCLDCHGLAFSLDALADAALVQTNFAGRPARHVESIDLAVRRQAEIKKSKPKP
jgi:hypothetical protein